MATDQEKVNALRALIVEAREFQNRHEGFNAIAPFEGGFVANPALNRLIEIISISDAINYLDASIPEDNNG